MLSVSGPYSPGMWHTNIYPPLISETLSELVQGRVNIFRNTCKELVDAENVNTWVSLNWIKRDHVDTHDNSGISKKKVKVFPVREQLKTEPWRPRGEWIYVDPHFLHFGTSWGWLVSFTTRPLYLGERTPVTHYIGGWVDPRACLGYMEKRTFLALPGLELHLTPRSSSP
jgi:hypothetical protein